ncbi:MAG: class I SAM-dependent methyltransferase [Armatimonadota bacterium]
MTSNGRNILLDYYNKAASNYYERMSGGIGGWLRGREVSITYNMIPQDGKGMNTLDAGCGPCFYSALLKERGFNVTAIDISPEMVKIARNLGFPAYVMDIEYSAPPEELPTPFDFVLCAGVLEFANDPAAFLRSLRNMAKEGAEIAVVAPMAGAFGRFYRSHLVKRGIPARVYTKKSLEEAMRNAGLEPIEVRAKWPICLAAKARAI